MSPGRRDSFNTAVGVNDRAGPIAVRHNNRLSAAGGYGGLIAWTAARGDSRSLLRLNDLTSRTSRRRRCRGHCITGNRARRLRGGGIGLNRPGWGAAAYGWIRRRERRSAGPSQRRPKCRGFRLGGHPAGGLKVPERQRRGQWTRPDAARLSCQRRYGRFLALHPLHVFTGSGGSIWTEASGKRRIPPGLVAATA